ncbi:dihydrofolate reductase [Ramaria rubella]|nr:dihydrofolate reductase [Ramaria rubella]
MSSNKPRDFLSSILPSPIVSLCSIRPHVTLTYAQSLDGRIAGVGGEQLILSGKESMVMTHWLRTMHDGILVGIGTALNDNPQLNARHLPARDDPYPLPRPIILDTDLRLSISCKLLENFQNCRGRRPWIICSDVYSPEKCERKRTLGDAGARIIEVPLAQNRLCLSLGDVLTTVRNLGIHSLMVEGGQRIISSFLSHVDKDAKPVVDIVIVTVAPTLVGTAGIGILSEGSSIVRVPMLDHVRSVQLGRDTVIACCIAQPA